MQELWLTQWRLGTLLENGFQQHLLREFQLAYSMLKTGTSCLSNSSRQAALCDELKEINVKAFYAAQS
jgi:hypothetical protein